MKVKGVPIAEYKKEGCTDPVTSKYCDGYCSPALSGIYYVTDTAQRKVSEVAKGYYQEIKGVVMWYKKIIYIVLLACLPALCYAKDKTAPQKLPGFQNIPFGTSFEITKQKLLQNNLGMYGTEHVVEQGLLNILYFREPNMRHPFELWKARNAYGVVAPLYFDVDFFFKNDRFVAFQAIHEIADISSATWVFGQMQDMFISKYGPPDYQTGIATMNQILTKISCGQKNCYNLPRYYIINAWTSQKIKKFIAVELSDRSGHSETVLFARVTTLQGHDGVYKTYLKQYKEESAKENTFQTDRDQLY